MTLDQFKAKLLSDPEVKQHYDALGEVKKYQVYETWYGDQEGEKYGKPVEMSTIEIEKYCEELGDRHEGYLYIAVEV